MTVIKSASLNTAATALVGSFFSAVLAFGLAVVAEAPFVESMFPSHVLALLFFAITIPITYQVGGSALYGDQGWQWFQPGKGGARFVALNGIAWTFYPICLLAIGLGSLSKSEQVIHDCKVAGGASGLLSYVFMVSSLLSFHPARYSALSNIDDQEWTETFNRELQRSALMHNGETTSGFWFLFVGMQLFTSGGAAFLTIIVQERFHSPQGKGFGMFLAMAMITTSAAVSHTLGGKWRHVGTSYESWQPFKGGLLYIILQIIGWCFVGLSILLTILPFLCTVADRMELEVPPQLFEACRQSYLIPNSAAGVIGFIGEIFIVLSLFTFEDEEDGTKKIDPSEKVLCSPVPFTEYIISLQFSLLNMIFGPRNAERNSRALLTENHEDHFKCEEKWKKCTSRCKTTGNQYLIIGVGFVGKRLVKRLLDRGETKIRIFDISPQNPFPGDNRVEYVRGDVTNLHQITQACQGVHTVYCTFAIIRFMDRLDHQAALSYKINCIGTEMVLKAAQKENVKYIIVTSSSHATTDEHSMPRLNRTEEAPYVTRETAHNHYGWTKALSDAMCLKADNSITANGGRLRITIVRPCSGVFGADDRFSFEKAANMAIYPVLGAQCVCDWVYVENVVLGHLLAEAAFLNNVPGVGGEAFNISNCEAYTQENFWWSVYKHWVQLKKNAPNMVKTSFRVIYIPEAPLWVIAHISELNQRLFRGKISLGNDVDMLTPPALATALLHYSYNSDKANRVLGYTPAFTVDEAIQRSWYEYYQIKFGIPGKKIN